MVDQLRRLSLSICPNLAEGWRKLKCKAVFVNKVSDAMMEASETQTWLEFSLACKHISQKMWNALDNKYENIIGMLNSVESADSKNPGFCRDKFCY